MLRTLTLSAIAGGFALCAAAAPIKLQPGEWSYDMEMSMMGNTMNDSNTDCLGVNESNLEPQAFADEFAGGANCTAVNVRQNGNTVSFDMSCPGEPMDGAKFKMTHQLKSFVMTADLNMAMGETRVPGTMVVNARYNGACTN